ncbi:thiamine biosynthesis protein ThiF [Evtepia sp.]|uniref:thiamine biosynthesis protein ThiF n=1 Tax=Evtepia sp. TaxID=2773933 RepID=UPI002707647A|nr:thiamine biosynthesis protein ThiF [Evtepia sp.]MDO5596240.1 thiamine biosynthesis protein ThiF [Bacillota bacterium]MEE0256403.1 thiamine biosynthesis protein ThiF [Evtepia sp.]
MAGLQAHPIPSREVMREALNIRHGEDLQNKISAARVAVCGLGGLGSNIAIALARAGVGHLHLIDFDRVDLTNLNRQQYAVGQLGQYKTDALRETLSLVSPYCDVTCDTIQVTEENLPDLLKTEDYICEAFDRAEAKAMLVSGVLEHFPEKYLVAGSGLAGLGSANTIQTRRVSQRFYLCGDGTSDSSVGLGLVASRVLVCAAHEANMILRLIAGETEP